ncbi:MAG TPA: hypothetical protein VIK89_02245 [Cytophagaceae bacterium]
MTLEQLIQAYLKWSKEDLTQARLQNDELSYKFASNSLGYDLPFDVKSYQQFFDRKNLDDECVARYGNKDIKSKKPSAWLQAEINTIHAFHKCFAMRHASRLQYYKNDLIQKGARNSSTIMQALGKFIYRRDFTEQS